MTNFNTEIHDKVSLLAKGTTEILDRNLSTLKSESNHKRKKTMMAMLNGSKLLSMTIGNMVTTEADQSEVISNLIQSLTNTYKVCFQYDQQFTTTDGLLEAWHSGLTWATKREAKPVASSNNVLNLFENE
tara:strand:- start:1135 stop:1524 length:390 start_codon:yes stop_codon:yes gene_type:complete